MGEQIRLQKALASAGVASRRASEILIARGRIVVNGKVISEQGTRVDPDTDVIRVDGKRIPPPSRNVYLAFNKPVGVLSSMEAAEQRPTLASYVKGSTRLFHVGRLDVDTSGLLFLTNDGELTQRLTHPSYEVSKVYLAQVRGIVDQKMLTRLRNGLVLEDGPIKPDRVRLLQTASARSLLEITLHSGRNRIVRRMFEEIRRPVLELTRLAVGPVRLGSLKSGQSRALTNDELGALFDLVEM